MAWTSIGFGGGEVIELSMSLDDARVLFQRALKQRSLVEITNSDGIAIVINPLQVKVLQATDERRKRSS